MILMCDDPTNPIPCGSACEVKPQARCRMMTVIELGSYQKTALGFLCISHQALIVVLASKNNDNHCWDLKTSNFSSSVKIHHSSCKVMFEALSCAAILILI